MNKNLKKSKRILYGMKRLKHWSDYLRVKAYSRHNRQNSNATFVVTSDMEIVAAIVFNFEFIYGMGAYEM